MTDIDYDNLAPLVQRVAKSVANSFPSYVDRNDLEQAVYLWLLEKRSWLSKIAAQDEGAFEAKIAPMMRKVALTEANGEKAAAEGYAPDDVFRYSIEKIQTLLDDVFDYEDWQSFAMKADDMPRARGQVNETGDRLAELTDVKAAVERLKEESYNLLVWRYKYQWTNEAIAEEYGITPSAASQRHKAALRGVQKELGYREPEEMPGAPAGRRAVRSNAAWRATLEDGA